MLGVPPAWAHEAGFILVIALTTYASLIIGELVPKQVELRAPEGIACVVAGPLKMPALATVPFVWLRKRCSAMIFLLLRMLAVSVEPLPQEALHLIVA